MNIAECLSMRRPVISSCIGNAGDRVSDSNAGALFDLNDSTNLKKALDEVINNKDFYVLNAYNSTRLFLHRIQIIRGD